MNDDLKRSLALQKRRLAGPDPMEKHILLLKLSEAAENAPSFGPKPILEAGTPQRQWLSQVRALLIRLDSIGKKVKFETNFEMLSRYWEWGINQIQGQVADAIEELKLDLELDGRSEIGSAYSPGEIYRFFADLKAIINSARREIVIIDPYFDGAAFDAYLTSANVIVDVRILANQYSAELLQYAKRYEQQHGKYVEVRRSKKLHDRLIFVDENECWIMGGSIKDAGKKATYLIPVGSEIAHKKLKIYNTIWEEARTPEYSESSSTE